MSKSLSFFQILLAVFIANLVSDMFKGYSKQCLVREKNRCVETRFECVVNSRKTPFIIPACFVEKQI